MVAKEEFVVWRDNGWILVPALLYEQLDTAHVVFVTIIFALLIYCTAM